jgi:hypothetical protein
VWASRFLRSLDVANTTPLPKALGVNGKDNVPYVMNKLSGLLVLSIMAMVIGCETVEESSQIDSLSGKYTVCREKQHWCCGTQLDLLEGRATMSRWGDDGPWEMNLVGEYRVSDNVVEAKLEGTREVGSDGDIYDTVPIDLDVRWHVFRKGKIVVLVPENDLECPFRPGNPWSPLVRGKSQKSEAPACSMALEILGNLDSSRAECKRDR